MSQFNSKKPAYAGLSINRHRVELTLFSTKGNSIDTVVSQILPPGVFDTDGDQILNPSLLKEAVAQVLKQGKPPQGRVHLSLPGTLLRMVEMPKMDSDGLYISLSSEAERYRAFDGTEAIVDFTVLDHDRPGQMPTANNQQTVVFGGLRSDTLGHTLKILKGLRVKPVTIGLEPLNVLRALAASGVLDGIVQEIGMEAFWGTIFIEPSRIRLMIWQGNRLIDLRETAMETSQFGNSDSEFFMIEDLLEEIRRTTRNTQTSVWITHDMPSGFRQNLSSRLGSPIFEATLGTALSLPTENQADLSAVGAATSSLVPFPFAFDIGKGQARLGGGNANPLPGTAETFSGGEESSFHPLMAAGVASIALGIVVSGILFLLNMMASQQIPTLTSARDSIQMEVTALQSREQELRRKAELDKSLLEAVKDARIRNQVYIALTNDLKHKTPQQIWIQTLKAGEKLEMQGKGMNQNAVIHFAQSFDDAPYVQSILIDAIKEEKLSGSVVYDFKVSGGVKLPPELLPPDDEKKPESDNPSDTSNSGGDTKKSEG